MPKRRDPQPPEASLAAIQLDSGAERPLYRQIYGALRREILAGRLRPGQKLTSSRALSEQLGVSRPTALLAYDMLLSEGYVEGRAGSGTFVSRALPERLLRVQTKPSVRAQKREPPPRIATQHKHLPSAKELIYPGPRVPFRMGLPALDHLPHAAWAKIGAKLLGSPLKLNWDYGDPVGDDDLRRAIAEHLGQHRGLHCVPEQIMITGGSQQALDLTARVLLEPGEECWVEDPCYLGALSALRAARAQIAAVPVDTEGLMVERGKSIAPAARLVYVTPSHQYPLGVTMSLARRLELLEWAREADAWIVEDDYDSEFRYGGKPLSPLKHLDAGNRVIYIGTFSKVLFPAMRIGYMVLPEALMRAFISMRYASSRQAPSFEQALLARFMDEGHLVRHIRRMRVLYQERQLALREIMAEELGDLITIQPAEKGMHVVGWLPPGTDERELCRQAANVGVKLAPLSALRLKSKGAPGILLGYSGFDSEQMHLAARKLSRALKGGKTSSKKKQR